MKRFAVFWGGVTTLRSEGTGRVKLRRLEISSIWIFSQAPTKTNKMTRRCVTPLQREGSGRIKLTDVE